MTDGKLEQGWLPQSGAIKTKHEHIRPISALTGRACEVGVLALCRKDQTFRAAPRVLVASGRLRTLCTRDYLMGSRPLEQSIADENGLSSLYKNFRSDKLRWSLA